MISRAGIFLVLCAVMSAAPRILVHGHRGARAIYPENTIPAFEYAIRQGADVLEMDLAVTRDNVLVISHDPYLNPEICTGPHPGIAIHELTLAELQQYDCGTLKNPRFPKQQPVPGTRIPTLDQVLNLSRGSTVQFNIETKSFPEHPELTPTPEVFARLMLDQIRKHKVEARVIMQSFDFRTLHAMKKLAPEIRLAALYEGPPRSFVDIAQEAGATIISPYYELVTLDQVKASHAAGLEVVPWTADTPAVWQMLIDSGVDAIIGDDPAALLAYLKSRGRH
jgi:glycerophosphoryl diester phosphodiesterase